MNDNKNRKAVLIKQRYLFLSYASLFSFYHVGFKSKNNNSQTLFTANIFIIKYLMTHKGCFSS